MTRVTEAERLRRCREVFALAQAESLTMEAAAREHARRRWEEADARLRARRCGTDARDLRGPAPEGARWMARD